MDVIQQPDIFTTSHTSEAATCLGNARRTIIWYSVIFAVPLGSIYSLLWFFNNSCKPCP